MNKRSSVVFGFGLLLIIFVVAKWATRWRPVAIGSLNGVKPIDWDKWQTFEVSNRYIIAGDNENRVLFDLQNGQLRPSKAEGITQDGTALWKAMEENQRQIIIQNDNAPRLYDAVA